jgi:hypothetical protein
MRVIVRQDVVGHVVLPEHETAVCPECERPAMIRGDICECSQTSGCGYRWRWPALEMEMG